MRQDQKLIGADKKTLSTEKIITRTKLSSRNIYLKKKRFYDLELNTSGNILTLQKIATKNTALKYGCNFELQHLKRVQTSVCYSFYLKSSGPIHKWNQYIN